jgi:pimeloyl-ACP methyl ester carboxylesterase
MLPLGTYALHEDKLIKEPAGVRTDFRETLACNVLQQDPEARVIINFHGNAGHLADGHRIQIYRSLTNLSPKVHIIAIDYRGFGYSTGSPHEAGVIADGITVVNYILSLGIPPSRIILLGQSLGTAITSGVALHFANRDASLKLLPQTDNQALNDLFMNSSVVVGHSRTQPTNFAAVILIASFPSLPKLLLTYRMSGLIPLLSPLRVYPKLQQWLVTFIQEDWPTSLRIAALVTSAATSQERRLRLHLVHALDDWDIPWQNGEQNYEAACHALASASGEETIGMVGMDLGEEGFKREAKLGERVKVVFESVRFGGKLEHVR